MTFWLGRPGNLTALPDPAPGVGASLVRGTAEHLTLRGGRVVDFAGDGRRTFRLRWERLTDDEFNIVEAFHTGGNGPGPWALLPTAEAWNYLTPNQSSGGDTTGDTTGFSILNSGSTLAVVETDAFTGRRALAWSVPALPAATTRVLLTGPGGLPGLPVLPGVPLAFIAHMRAAAPVEVSVGYYWRDRDGTTQAISNSAATAASPTWTPYKATATPPDASIVYATPTVTVRRESVAAATVVEIDGLRVDVNAAPVFRPGRGVPLVSMVELSESYPWSRFRDCEATLVEVG